MFDSHLLSLQKNSPFISLPNLRKLLYSLLDKQKYVYGTFIAERL